MILVILQARTSSSRLPGKVLKPILDKPMILRQIERLARSKKIGKLILATSIDKSDDELVKICLENNIECFRGSLENVLERFYFTAEKYKPDTVVRLTGDCPLIDSNIIDKVIEFYQNNRFEYVSNTIPPTFPDGMDVEVFSFNSLKTAYENATLPSEIEHVTPYIRTHFATGNFENKQDLSGLRWTVDEEEDYELVNTIYEALYKSIPHFTMENVLNYLEQNENISTINKKFTRNEGFEKSLLKDKEFKNV